MDFVKQQFDKLLLAALFLTVLAVFLHALHHSPDSGTVNWLEQIVGQILAALLTLMVGSRLQQRAQNNGAPPEPPKS